MRLHRLRAGWLACCVVLALTAHVHGEAQSPLRFIPPQADLLVQIPRPQSILDAVSKLAYLRQLDKLEAYRELLDSTNVRRLYQVLAYFEKELGCPRAELLDRLAGEGVVFGAHFAGKPAPFLAVVQGRDAELTRMFFQLGLGIIEQDLARQESKDKVERSTHGGNDVARIGDGFFVARVGSALVFSNTKKALSAALDLDKSGGKNIAASELVLRAGKLLPGDALASLWINFDSLHRTGQAKEVFSLPRNDPQLTVLFGGLLDVARRAPFLCAGLYEDRAGFKATVRLPAGRDGLAAGLEVHVPPAGQPASLPLLEPKGVLYSTSYYLDLAQFWEQRVKLFTEPQVKTFEEADKKSALFFGGNRLSKFFGMAGPHQRVVVAHQQTSGYQTKPAQRLPAFAFVLEMRDADKVGPALQGTLRSAGLLATTQFGLKLVEEKVREHTLVSYRFPEGQTPPPLMDTSNVRYNFTPCFAVVGNQFMASSTIELGRELIGLIDKESTTSNSHPATVQSQLYAAGGADLLAALDDQLFAQTFLDQAFAPDVARQQVEAFIGLVRSLGVFRAASYYEAGEFHYDFDWQPSK